ncbi:sensor histidine kinase [Ferruginibacter albus]|uniref:sensor histidine kinase n=1 Tax=Ferruginibacter albus TaxID=2875540 RepID=UPI001CC54DF7|nr:HAMP domain-containing sensor histidine kinase [Ferruginibacter albus]UAY53473.1 HAMP domain-containing histidine kinase [Ferruginibacter albus]
MSYKYQTIINFIAILSIATGLLVISGWILNNVSIVCFLPSHLPVKLSTAICMILSGFSQLFFYKKGKYNALLYRTSSIMMIFIAGLYFFSNIFHYRVFIDTLFNNSVSQLFTSRHVSLGMSYAPAICFFILGLAYIYSKSNIVTIRLLVQWGLHIVTLMSVIALMGHLYKVPNFYKIPFFSPMATHTAVAIFLLSIAGALINPSLGIAGLLTGDKIGNIAARRIFPTFSFLLLGFAYIRLEVYRRTSLGIEFSAILFSVAIILTFLIFIWYTAVQLNKIDAKRKAAEESMALLNIHMEQKIEHRTINLKEALLQLEASKQELSQALEKEKELGEIKSQFVSLASHEFKTPLSTILSSASLIALYENENDQPSREKHVQRITQSVMHLNSVLEDFLSIGKLESGHVNVEPSLFNIDSFIKDILDEMKMTVKQGQQLQFALKGGGDFVTDKRLLKNILINVLSNAIKFSNNDIVINIANKADELHILVEDKGIGIPVEDQKHLFSSFYRAKNASHISGTGLGLHIVKRYIDLLHGAIELQSEAKKGTSVYIRLPFMNQPETIIT